MCVGSGEKQDLKMKMNTSFSEANYTLMHVKSFSHIPGSNDRNQVHVLGSRLAGGHCNHHQSNPRQAGDGRVHRVTVVGGQDNGHVKLGLVVHKQIELFTARFEY